jgi:hypothetical protein
MVLQERELGCIGRRERNLGCSGMVLEARWKVIISYVDGEYSVASLGVPRLRVSRFGRRGIGVHVYGLDSCS